MSSATAVGVRPGKTTARIDGHLVIGGTISGRVVNASGTPLRNICDPIERLHTGQSGAGPVQGEILRGLRSRRLRDPVVETEDLAEDSDGHQGWPWPAEVRDQRHAHEERLTNRVSRP